METTGKNGLPAVVIKGGSNKRSSTEACIYLHGAHLASWKVDDQDIIFMSEKAVYQPPKALRGGVPICFPQFGDMGPCAAQHGFARNTSWSVVNKTDNAVTLQLSIGKSDHAEFPYDCEISIKTEILADDSLQQTMTVKNVGEDAFPFTCALHTYFAIHDIKFTTVRGLQGCSYLDSLENRVTKTQTDDEVRFEGEVDRIYCHTRDTLDIVDSSSSSGRHIRLTKTNFPDAVVWNPHIAKAAGMADFGDDEWQRMVCVEVAQAGSGPISLEPGTQWGASQTLQAL